MAMARLQQALCLGLLGASAAWAAYCVHAGKAQWAPVMLAALVGTHAILLALELALVALVHRQDPAPRATPGDLFNAWRGELLHAPRVFCWRQPFRSQRIPDHLPALRAPRRGVVFIHGFVCNRGLWNPWMQRLRAQGVPFVAVTLEPPFGSIDTGVATIEAAVRRIEACTGLSPVMVAHSMGGLALRRWWAESADDDRVHHAITLGTPHAGTWLARFAFSRNGREMQQGSAWLATLAAREPARRARRFTCFHSHSDNVVFPASTATLPGADNRHLRAVAHVQMVDRPEPWQALQEQLRAGEQPQPAAGSTA